MLKEEKVRAVTEKYYILNRQEAHLNKEEWQNYTASDKLNYYSYYQLSLYNQYQNYLTKVDEDPNASDVSTFSVADLKLDDARFQAFQHELNELMMKYYNESNENTEHDTTRRTIGITIIPES